MDWNWDCAASGYSRHAIIASRVQFFHHAASYIVQQQRLMSPRPLWQYTLYKTVVTDTVVERKKIRQNQNHKDNHEGGKSLQKGIRSQRQS
jgi:hypothetical protein